MVRRFLAALGRVRLAGLSDAEPGVVFPSLPDEKQVISGWFPAATESASRTRASNICS